MIPYGAHTIDDDDIEEVVSVLKNEFLTQGHRVPNFEKQVALYCGAKYGVAMNSATSALHAACMAVGLSKGDILWTVPISFVASANVGKYCGAIVDFVDIDIRTRNIDIVSLEEKLEISATQGLLPKVLIVVHFAGNPCDMERVAQLSQIYGFKIIEDASHAIGSSYKQTKVGSCQYSDATVFSFHPVKNITTGEGGMLTTNNYQLASCAQKFRSHGVVRQKPKLSCRLEQAWYYEMQEIGYNYRMTDLGAALGQSQLKKLDKFITVRNTLRDNYENAFDGIELNTQIIDPANYSAWHIYTILIPENRDLVYEFLQSNGIAANVHYIPIHLHPFWQKSGFKSGDFPSSEAYYSKTLTIPLFPGLTTNQQEYVIEKVQEGLKEFV